MLPFPFVAILASTAFVQAQTLYELARTDTLPATGLWEQELGSTALSAVGVGADGMTTYVRNVFVTAIGYSQSGSVFGLKPTTAEIDFTFAEDASRIQAGPTTGQDIHAACTFGPNGEGACVEVVPDLTTTLTTTVTGSVVPWTTLKVDAAVATLSSTSSSSSPTAPAPNGANTFPHAHLVAITLPVLFHALWSLS